MRPTTDILRIQKSGRSTRLERVLTDFGADESFAKAAKKLREHYGFEMGRTTILRVVENRAEEIQSYVEERLQDSGQDFASNDDVEVMVVQLDGCQIRTGILQPSITTGNTSEVRNLPKRTRDAKWREVRTGFPRPLDDRTPTFISSMASYEDVCASPCSAATEKGLGLDTKVVAIADGGIGLREGLDVVFSDMQFVLDKYHFKKHAYEVAEAMGLAGVERKKWVHILLDEVEADSLRVARLFESFYRTRTSARSAVRWPYYKVSRRCCVQRLRRKGFPVGSGEIESAQRYIPQDRLKIPGACWHPDTVNPMLALRVLRQNGWWNDFWQSAAKAA